MLSGRKSHSTILMSLACLIKCANFKQHNLTLELLVLHGFSGGSKKKKKEKTARRVLFHKDLTKTAVTHSKVTISLFSFREAAWTSG